MSTDEIFTERLWLRRPTLSDAEAIFRTYAGDPEVTRYLAWPTHRSVDDTVAFLKFSDSEWARWPAGPLLIFSGADLTLIGSTGLGFEDVHRASTGYVLAKSAWGLGYATEVTSVMVQLAEALGVARLHAICHHEHTASRRVLEKSGFRHEGIVRDHTVFPNLSPKRQDVHLFVRGSVG